MPAALAQIEQVKTNPKALFETSLSLETTAINSKKQSSTLTNQLLLFAFITRFLPRSCLSPPSSLQRVSGGIVGVVGSRNMKKKRIVVSNELI